jgi:membrane fusion protein (multidrug efflux system)
MKKKSPESETSKTGGKRLLGYLVKAALILAAVAIVAGIAKMPSQKREAPPTEAPPVNVTVETVAAEPELADTFELPAVVEPNRVVRVAAEVSGRIEYIGPKKGDVVRAGNLLIQLNADLLRPQFDSAKAQLDFDQIQYKRMANLVEENATTQRDLDTATAQLAASKARVEEIRARLDRTAIRAPIGGALDDLLVEEGEYVDPGNPVAQLVETDPVKVVVEVPERDTAFFAPDDKAEVLTETKGIEKCLVGHIEFISELADPQTRSTRMEILLGNKERLLRSGQIVRVRLTRRILKDAILIPLLAVIPMEEGMAVYVVSAAQAERREVQLGAIKGDHVQVLSGLKAGDQLIVAGHRFVAPGQKVNVVPAGDSRPGGTDLGTRGK